MTMDFVKDMQCSILGFSGVNSTYSLIPGHCDLQTDISNCLGEIISCPQIDLTLPAGAHFPCIQFEQTSLSEK